MKTVNIHTDDSISNVPISVDFQARPGESFPHNDQVCIQLVNNDGVKVGNPEIRSVVKIHDGDEQNAAWYQAFIPAKQY